MLTNTQIFQLMSIIHARWEYQKDIQRRWVGSGDVGEPGQIPQNSATFLEEELDTSVREHTLLHGEALLVIASRNSEDVTLELISQCLTGHLRRHPLVKEWQ